MARCGSEEEVSKYEHLAAEAQIVLEVGDREGSKKAGKLCNPAAFGPFQRASRRAVAWSLFVLTIL